MENSLVWLHWVTLSQKDFPIWSQCGPFREQNLSECFLPLPVPSPERSPRQSGQTVELQGYVTHCGPKSLSLISFHCERTSCKTLDKLFEPQTTHFRCQNLIVEKNCMIKWCPIELGGTLEFLRKLEVQLADVTSTAHLWAPQCRRSA